jgi:hypothetical protein
MTFSAVVLRVAPEVLTVRVRGDAQEKTVMLRPDTRFLAHGAPVTEAALRPNTKVFLRAGKNLDGQLEAFQVVWGDILQPQ